MRERFGNALRPSRPTDIAGEVREGHDGGTEAMGSLQKDPWHARAASLGQKTLEEYKDKSETCTVEGLLQLETNIATAGKHAEDVAKKAFLFVFVFVFVFWFLLCF